MRGPSPLFGRNYIAGYGSWGAGEEYFRLSSTLTRMFSSLSVLFTGFFACTLCVQGLLTLFIYSYKVIYVTCGWPWPPRWLPNADDSRAPCVITWWLAVNVDALETRLVALVCSVIAIRCCRVKWIYASMHHLMSSKRINKPSLIAVYLCADRNLF